MPFRIAALVSFLLSACVISMSLAWSDAEVLLEQHGVSEAPRLLQLELDQSSGFVVSVAEKP